MAIERMKLLSITGREELIDSFITKYLLESGMQTENATKVFEKGWKLKNFEYDNQARELSKKCTKLLDFLDIRYKEEETDERIISSLEEIDQRIELIQDEIDKVEGEINTRKEELKKIDEKEKILQNAKNLDIDITRLYDLDYMSFRYGKISKENLEKLERSIRELDAFVVPVNEKDEDVWIVCIVTKELKVKIDSYLNLYKFERIWFPDDIKGNPKELLSELENERYEIAYDIESKSTFKATLRDKYEDELKDLLKQINLYLKINAVKKYMAHDENGLFYIVGWIPTSELKELLPKLSKERDLRYVVKSHDEVATLPPTKLKNMKIFKPFEEIVKMYGIPNYNENDPTVFVAITAFLMFGFMFGDIGHGLIFFIIGLWMARKKMALGPVFSAGGISSMIFGLLYGSVFGLEDVIPALLIRPMDNIQTMLILGIAFGVIMIITTMFLNIRNGLKQKDDEKIYFDTNGFAGLIFYIAVLIIAIYYLISGKMLASGIVLSIFVIIPLLAIMFKQNLAKMFFKKKIKEESSMSEKVFEIIEVLLSFMSNTISFVRVSAFAINHVGLSLAVYVLSSMATGAGNLLIVLIGNALIIVLEGLIVSIQVLRLEFYELFSRFYSGDGREYEPLREKIS